MNDNGGKHSNEELLELSPSRLSEVIRVHCDPDGLLQQLIVEVTVALTEDVEKSLKHLQLIQTVVDSVGVSKTRVQCCRSLARAYSYQGQYQSAIDVCIKGYRISADNDLAVEDARLRMASMHALTELGRFDEALDAGQTARETLLAIDEPALAARVEINLGIVNQRMGNLIQSLVWFNRARAGLPDDDPAIGPLENNRGEALLLQNEFIESEEAFSNALRAFDANGYDLHSAIAEGNLADLALRQGHLAESLSRFEKARQRFEVAGSPAHLARLMAEQAEAKVMLGLHDEALIEYRNALTELDIHGLPLESARAKFSLGRLLLRAREYAEAESVLVEASTEFAELGLRVMRARVDIARGEGKLSIKLQDEARKLVMRVLPELGDHPIDAIPGYLLLATIAMNCGDFVEAGSQLSIAQSRSDEIGISQLNAVVARVKGDNHALQGNYETASLMYGVAIDHIEQLRSSLQAQRFKLALASEVADLYEQYISTLILLPKQNQEAAVYSACERARSRSLLEEIHANQRTSTKRDNIVRSPHYAELETLQSRIEGLYSRLTDEGGTIDRKEVLDELKILECKASDFESRIASSDPSASVYRKPLSLQETQQSLDGRTVLATYFSVGDALHLQLVTSESTTITKDIGSVSELGKIINRLQFQITRVVGKTIDEKRSVKVTREIDRLLQQAYKLLVKPFEHLLQSGTRLVVIPCGEIQSIPLAALPIRGKRLIEICELVVCPSASLYIALKQIARSSDQRALVVATTDEHTPSMLEEANAVAQILEPTGVITLVNRDATVITVQELMPTVGLLHFACHGRFDVKRPHLSGLQLDDGWLSANAIHRTGIAAELVILGACESGCSAMTVSQEMLGLARSFLSSGAKSVLGTLWQVDDACSKKFLCTFHEILSTMKLEPVAVLQKTQINALQSGVAIWDWAGFSVIGAG